MLPTKPYLFRAFYDWIVDNGWTPYVVIMTNRLGVKVPSQFIINDEIVLSIHPESVMNLLIDKQQISFDASFSGIKKHITAPISAIKTVYAKENGQGIVFTEEPLPPKVTDDSSSSDSDTGGSNASDEKSKSGNHLRIVK